MATSTTSSKESKEAARRAAEDEKIDQQIQSKLNEFIRQYSVVTPETGRDTLAGRFRIELSSPLPDYDTKTARAYNVVDSSGEFKNLFALIIPPGKTVRYNAVETLKGVRHPNLMTLVASGVVEFSQPAEEKYVLVYEKPPGKKLSQILSSQNLALTDYFIVNGIISPLIQGIHQLSELGIAHGAINTDNIYFKDVPVLGDCVSEPCGYSQPFYCEPLERLQCLPSAKGEGTSAQDYYALAVVVVQVIFGAQHFAGLTPQTHIKNILKYGAYAALLRNKDTTLLMDEFFRGTLGQEKETRWNYRYLKSWVEGRRSSAILSRPSAEVLKPFEYGDGASEIIGASRRELAHEFFMHWDVLGDMLQSGHLISWMAINLRNKELVTEISRISKAAHQLASKQEHLLSEQFMRLIQALDPTGPARIYPLALMPDGIHTLCAELVTNKSEREIQVLAKFIENDMVTYWTQSQATKEGLNLTPSVNAMLTKLDKMRLLLRNPAIGFGVERLLYELNPDMACQSPFFANAHVTSMASLLRRLDRIAPTLYTQQDPMDRHIAAFVSQKLNLQSELKLHELGNITALSNNRSILALKLLALAQHRSGNLVLPGLSHWLALRILPSLDVIRSKTLRQKLKQGLAQRAASGSLPALEEFIIDNSYANADCMGHQRAVQTYLLNTQKIREYRTPAVIDRDSAIVGATIAKSFSYFIFGITLLFTIRAYL